LSGSHEFEPRPQPAAVATISRRPLWRLRLVYDLPRYLLYAFGVAGSLASARIVLAPPRTTPALSPAAAPSEDRAAAAFAVLFARRYLTWDAADPQLGERSLASVVGSQMDPGAGLVLPAAGSQRVEWAEVVQQRRQGPGASVYTVAVQTDVAGLLYLSVGVERTARGALALSGYPAFVGAPVVEGAQLPSSGPEIADPALIAVTQRALRNYLAGSREELDADLAPGARVALPGNALNLTSVQRLTWSADRRSVVVAVQAQDARGARYTLSYELDVHEIAGRWEVSALQMDPYR
jgi:hypothetical protein